MNTTMNNWIEPAMPRHLERARMGAVDEDESLFGLARSLIAMLWRWRLLILAIGAAGGAAAWFALSTMPSTYIARAAMFFDFSRQTVVSDLPAEAIAPSGAMLNTELEILTSRDLMNIVVEELGLVDDPEFNPWLTDDPEAVLAELVKPFQERTSEGGPAGTVEPPAPAETSGDASAETVELPSPDEVRATAVSILLGQLQVSLVPDSYVFTITVETLSPEKSARIANGVADIFIRERTERRSAASEDAIAWLERRTATLRERVLAAEDRVAEQRSQAMPGGQSSLSSMAIQIASFREQVATHEADARRLDELVTHIRTLGREGRLEEAGRAALAEVPVDTAREIQAAASLPFEGDRIGRLSSLINQASDQIAGAAAEARAKAATQQTELDDRLQEYEERTGEAQLLRDAEREAAASLAAYEAMLDRLKGRVAVDALDPFWPEAAVISRAVPPPDPASPNRELILALGAIGSLVVGSGFALLLSALFPVIGSVRDLGRATGVPVLAQLPMPLRARLPRLQRQLCQRTSSRLADGLRSLRIAIALESRDSAPRVLLLVSAGKGEGKSATAYLLAQSFLQAGRKVLLIDADPGQLRGRTPAGPGLDSVLLGKIDARESITRDEISGIDLLLAPEALRDDADLFASGGERVGLETIASGYGVVVIIAPPIGTRADARILARLADVVLVVVRRRRSRPDAVVDALDQLVSGGASRVATVLLS